MQVSAREQAVCSQRVQGKMFGRIKGLGMRDEDLDE